MRVLEAEEAERYQILEQLGVGGMGAVYRAQHRTTKRVVAFKQLNATRTGAKRRMFEALFQREYHTLVRLKHPRIIEAYDYGFNDDGPYYTMELLDGADLHQLAPLPFVEACRHLRDVASSLALLHAHRMLHRDISPRNVRLTADGRAKLIDFGALTSFGTATEIVGTPPCMAPEVLGHLPLDQRTDLYALGALGYWAVTGRHAFPVRRMADLPSAWQQRPAPPSAFNPEIPAALDSLIMSLLSTDPLARPTHAAAVIDQLTAIAMLEPEEHLTTAESYLSSSKLVGREQELAWLQERIARGLAGKGSEILLEGSSGVGKTRLLNETCIAAQLRGAVVLYTDAHASSRAFGVVVALAQQLLAAVPGVARHALGQSATLLAHLSPELANQLETQATAELSQDPAERRACFQTALHEWFVKIPAANRTLILAVDNIQAADDNSAAFLAALGHEARNLHLVVLVAQTNADKVVAELPLRALRKRAARLKLANLGLDACEELVGSMFGKVSNTGRLAKLLYDKSAGNPQLCMDIVHLLITRKLANYIEGAWVLPFEYGADDLPNRMEESLEARLAELSPNAHRLCELLSIHDRRIPIEQCLAFSVGIPDRVVYSVLDELVAAQVLVMEDGSYGFRQQALRQCMSERIDDARRRSLHKSAADSLLSSDDRSFSTRVEAAWHLLRAGDEVRGADLIAGVTRDFLRHQGVESVEQIVAAIETAIALYEKQGRSKYEVASLLFPLMPLAFFVDWRITLKHGERAILLGLDITGLGLAQKLSRFLPDKLALGLGLITAAIRFGVRRLGGLKFSLTEAIEAFCSLVPATIGTQSIVFDLPATKRFTELLAPLRLFGKNHIAALMLDFAHSQYLLSHGKEKQATEILEELRRVFPDPAWKLKQILGAGHWKAMYGGILFSLGCAYPYEFGTHTLEIAREMEELGVRVWAMAAQEVRMLYHAWRGEAEDAHRCHERVELYAVQGSTTWQADIFWPVLLLDCEIRAGDTIAVRTIREQLTRRAKDHPSLQAFADVAHCTYLTMRGEHRAAIQAFEQFHAKLTTLEPERAWPSFRASFALASALNAVGEHERAKHYAAESMRRAGDEVERVVAHYHEPQRQLALAEAGLGNHAEALHILDGLFAASAGYDQPMLIGLLHKARAEVAISMRDGAAFEQHFEAVVKNFYASRKPTLVAQIDQLAKQAERAGVRASVEPRETKLAQPAESSRTLTVRALEDLSTLNERAELALRLVLERARAKVGFLYLLKDDQLELAAASSPHAPDVRDEARLRDEIELAKRGLPPEDDATQTVKNPGELEGSGEPHSVFIDSAASDIDTVTGHGAASLATNRACWTLLLTTKRSAERPVVVSHAISPPEPHALS